MSLDVISPLILGRNLIPNVLKNEHFNELRVSEDSLLVDLIKA